MRAALCPGTDLTPLVVTQDKKGDKQKFRKAPRFDPMSRPTLGAGPLSVTCVCVSACVCLCVLVCACVRHEMGGSGRRVEVEARGWIHWFSRSLQRTL